MEKVLEKFKNLFKGEECLKRHGMFLLLLLLPALAGGMCYVIDKDTPKEIVIPVLIITLVLLLLSIVPAFFLNGFAVDFFKSRIKSKIGLPKLDGEMFMKGLKVFPLQLYWGLLCGVLCLIGMSIPFALIIGGIVNMKSDPVLLILGLILFLVFYFLLIIAFLILAPFFNYIYLTFIEDFVYRGEYFNPMTLVYYIKTVFKDTMITMLKFLLASMIINMIVQTVVMIVVFFVGIFATFIGAATSGNSESIITPVSVIIMIPVCTLAVLVHSYTYSMISFAAGDAYIDIYKEKIRLPDPLDNQENPQQDDGWNNNLSI